MLSGEPPDVMDERDGLVVERCQALQVLVFALGREGVYGLVAVVEVGKKRVRAWLPVSRGEQINSFGARLLGPPATPLLLLMHSPMLYSLTLASLAKRCCRGHR